MKSYWIRTDGDHMRLEMREVDTPQARGQQMCVRIHAAALNRGELIAGHGLHSPDKPARPAGFEASGVVVSVGEGVQRFRVGDAVMGRCDGAFAEYGLMHDDEVHAKPECLSWAQAASSTITYATAHDTLMVQGHLKAGEWVLVTGVTSGVGVASLQLAKALGARVIGTSGSAERWPGVEFPKYRGPRYPKCRDTKMVIWSYQGISSDSRGGCKFRDCPPRWKILALVRWRPIRTC